MADSTAPDTTFRVTHETTPPQTLIAGFSSFGFAGLTAVDYLVDQLELTPTGYVTAEALPPITPFENGAPRHHTRLYASDEHGVAVLVNELFVPLWAADPFAKSILGWTDANGVEEICVLAGVPIPHGPEEHRVFYVASDDYRAHRLTDVDVPAMGNGFLDGVNASLLGRGLDTSLRTGVFLTPVHAQAPDVEAAIRLVDAVESLYGLAVETDKLEAFAGEIQQYYQELSERLQNVNEEQVPEDRMYM